MPEELFSSDKHTFVLQGIECVSTLNFQRQIIYYSRSYNETSVTCQAAGVSEVD